MCGVDRRYDDEMKIALAWGPKDNNVHSNFVA